MILQVHCSGGGRERGGGSSDPSSGASGNPDQQVRGRGRTWGLRINLSHSSWLPPIAHWSVPAKCVHPFMRCVGTQFDLLPRTQHFLLLPVLHWPLSSQMWCKSSIDRFYVLTVLVSIQYYDDISQNLEYKKVDIRISFTVCTHCVLDTLTNIFAYARPYIIIIELYYLLSMLQKVSTAMMALLIGVGGSQVHTITPRGKLHTTRPYKFPALVA